MKYKHLISVIVPIYNISSYIERCVESICSQTYSNLEIILINDGSSDESSKLCENLASNETRISLIHKKNMGASSARNTGIDIAQGTYIGFVDGDDSIEQDMYEILINNALKYCADISHCGCRIKFGNNSQLRNGTGIFCLDSKLEGIKRLILGKDVEPSLCNKLYKSSILNGVRLDERIHINEDFLLNYLLFKRSELSVFFDVCKYNYIKRNDSSLEFGNDILNIIYVAKIVLDDCQSIVELLPYAEHKYISAHISTLNTIIRTRKHTDKIMSIIDSIKKYTFKVLFSRIYSLTIKFAMILLVCNYSLYKIILLRVYDKCK